MYKGIPFSPKTTIIEDINAGSTVIKVADTSVFPEAPNLATIGTDEDAETILYSAKSGDSLSGCTRGVEGTAKSWSSGAIIARNFTAVEYGYIIDNIIQLFNEQEFTARINEEGHLIITLGTGTEIDCGNAKGDIGLTGPAGTNGKDGADGEDGGYYQPSVDDSGNLTWTASKTDMPSVDGVNIKGPAGQDGTNGKNATINGQNVLNLIEGTNISFEQSGSNLTINAGGGGIPVVATEGTGAAYTSTVPGITEISDGLLLVLTFHKTSTTTTPTLNVNGLGAYKIRRLDVSGMVVYDGPANNWLRANTTSIVMYRSGFWINLNSYYVSNSDVDVIASNDTGLMLRGIKLQTSTPSSVKNGSIVGVYTT